jgi:iron-sulfur cluster assembly protein
MLFVADSAKERIIEILTNDHKSLDEYFVRVTVTSGGCSGLSYKLDFDNDLKPADQVFEDKGIRLVTDLKSFLYVHSTILEFSGGLEGKGFYFSNPNASRTCACGESFSV